jgi:hypothetical protein
MTLIVFVRCQDGCVLASDRKATAGSGLVQEEQKSKVFTNGYAVGGAGEASAVKSLLTRLEEQQPKAADAVKFAKDQLEVWNQTSKIAVRCIVLVARNGEVDASLVETSDFSTSANSITSPFHCMGVPASVAVARHYLSKRNYQTSTCQNAAPEILAILKQACEKMEFVGEQEDYGFDIIIFRPTDYVYKTRITTEWAVLTSEIRPIEGTSPQFSFTSFGGAS